MNILGVFIQLPHTFIALQRILRAHQQPPYSNCSIAARAIVSSSAYRYKNEITSNEKLQIKNYINLSLSRCSYSKFPTAVTSVTYPLSKCLAYPLSPLLFIVVARFDFCFFVLLLL